ncbi:MAG: DUF58 domain-containing protein [Vicinamibacterales bacterium]
MDLFDPAFLKKLEYLHILSKRAFAGQFKGERRTRVKGTGIEFADHRGYTPGDDFRHIDWGAYQRLGRLLLRMFEEEQDLPIYLLVDQSQSMAHGSPSKLEYAKQVAAALCYIGLANLDKVTVVGYSNQVDAELRSKRGKSQIFNVFRFLTDRQPSGETDAREAFKRFGASGRQRGTAVVLSDFLNAGGFEEPLNALRYHEHDLFCVHIVAPSDADPALKGDLRLVDSETHGTHDISITPGMLEAYRRTFDTFCDELSRYCTRYQFGYFRTRTDTAFEDVILQAFRQGRFLAD